MSTEQAGPTQAEGTTGAQPTPVNEWPDDPDALRVRGYLPCGIERAWEFVTVPGWFINDDALREHQVSTPSPGRHLVVDPVYGEFEFEDVEIVPMRRYSTRGSHTGGDTSAPSTLTTFDLVEAGEGTELIITETGFAGLGLDEEATRAAIDANVEAWLLELRLAAAAVQAPA